MGRQHLNFKIVGHLFQVTEQSVFIWSLFSLFLYQLTFLKVVFDFIWFDQLRQELFTLSSNNRSVTGIAKNLYGSRAAICMVLPLLTDTRQDMRVVDGSGDIQRCDIPIYICIYIHIYIYIYSYMSGGWWVAGALPTVRYPPFNALSTLFICPCFNTCTSAIIQQYVHFCHLKYLKQGTMMYT